MATNKNWLWVALLAAAGALLMIAWMSVQGRPLAVCEKGISGQITLEVAGSGDRVQEIVNAWSAIGVIDVARQNIRIDYLFILSYTLFLFAGYKTLQVFQPASYSLPGKWIALVAFFPGVEDAIENLVMLDWLNGYDSFLNPAWLKGLVMAKFVIALGLALIVNGGLINLAIQKIHKH